MAVIDNIEEIYTDDSPANMKHLIFADKGEESGFFEVAKLIRDAAYIEGVRVHPYLQILEDFESQAEINRDRGSKPLSMANTSSITGVIK